MQLINMWPLDLVFDQLLNPFKGRKKLSSEYGGWVIFLWTFQRGWGGGVKHFLEKIKNPKQWGVLFKIPAVTW